MGTEMEVKGKADVDLAPDVSSSDTGASAMDNEQRELQAQIEKSSQEMSELSAKLGKFGVILEWIKELFRICHASKMFEKKDLRRLQEKVSDMERGLNNGTIPVEALPELMSCVQTALDAAKHENPLVVKEQMGMAQLVAMNKQAQEVFSGKYEVDFIEDEKIDFMKENGEKVLFVKDCPAGYPSIWVIEQDGHLKGSFLDAEELGKDLKINHDVEDFAISNENLTNNDMTNKDICQIGLDSLGILNKEVMQDAKERMNAEEMKTDVSSDTLQKYANYLDKNKGDLNLEITVNEENSCISIINKDNPEDSLLIVMTKDENGIEGISSMRQIDGKDFDAKNFDKEETLENSDAVAWFCKQKTYDYTNETWVDKDQIVFAENVGGSVGQVAEMLKDGFTAEEQKAEAKNEKEVEKADEREAEAIEK